MRYSLRATFVVIAVVAVAISIGLYATRDYRERMALQADLMSTTGARFASVNSERSIGLLFTKPVTSPEIKKYRQIRSIELKGFAVTNESLRNLAQLESVDVILFQSCTIANSTDLQPLSEIGSLRSLIFWNTALNASAIDVIADVPGLEIVDFNNTRLTQAEVDRLRLAKPEIKITNRP